MSSRERVVERAMEAMDDRLPARGRRIPPISLLHTHAAPIRYALMLGLLGLLLATPAVSAADLAVWARLLLGWFGACALLLSFMYLAKILGAAPERVLAAARPILLPYEGVALFTVILSRTLAREPMASEVAPRIWVGGAPLFWSRSALRARGIDSVLNLCIEFADLAGLRRSGMPYHRTPLLDGAAPLPAQLEEAVGWAAEQHGQGRALYIHCAQGHGRSATVAVALLVRLRLEPDPDAARERIRAARPAIRLGPAQRAAVERYWRGLEKR